MYGLSTMMESIAVANMDFGVVDPRKAAEMISMTFFNSVLKGLKRSPRIVVGESMMHASVLTAENVSVLVQPDGCLGLPTLAALEQGIPVVAVRDDGAITRNDLSTLPWREGQLIRVENYCEAAGVTLAMKAGVSLESTRRPLLPTKVTGLDKALEPRATANRDNGPQRVSHSETGAGL